MIRLTQGTSDLISLITAQNGAKVSAFYNDRTATAYGPGANQPTTISSATTTTIVSTPAASTVREIDYISIKNTFAGSHTMTVQLSVSATLYPFKTFTLLENESIEYSNHRGWVAMDVNGNIKESLSAASNWAVSGNLTVAGNATLGDAAADSLTINAGVYSAPNQPAFLAYNSASDLNVTGNAANADYICDTEVFDQGANFNNATGIFTAPVTGRHLFIARALVQEVSALMTQQNIEIVTSNRTYSHQDVIAWGSTKQLEIVVFADMDAADTAFPRIRLANGAADTADIYGAATGNYTTFAGRQTN